MEYVQQNKKRTWIKFILIILGLIVLFFAIFFVKDVLTIRQKILAGEYDLTAYGNNISGSGGLNYSQNIFNVESNDDPYLGSDNPKVTIVEFGDFECPYCQRSFPVIRSLISKYKDDVRYIYRDFPLQDIHPNAFLLAQAGYCAHKQNLFWPMHDKLFQNQNNINENNIYAVAAQVGLDNKLLESCLNSGESRQEVENDFLDGYDAGVQGTPTWFINGQRVAGVIPEEIFTQIIEDFIK